MALQPLYLNPGICKVNSQYASGKQFGYGNGRTATGRYIDGNYVRFVAGFPEKLAGWVSGYATPMLGRPSSACDYRDLNAQNHIAYGTTSHLYTFSGTTLTDITPRRYINSGQESNAISVIQNSPTVTINLSAGQIVQANQRVFLSNNTVIGGVLLNGWYLISTVNPGVSFTITVLNNATNSVSNAGGLLQYSYQYLTLGNNPFATVGGSSIITVTALLHGAVTGDYVTISGAGSVAGLTLAGEYQLTVLDLNTYTVDAGFPANTTTTGGGAAVVVAYDITIEQFVTGAPSNYGSGAFGQGPYGFVQQVASNIGVGWTISAYGGFVLAAPIGGTIYLYDGVDRAYPVLNAPSSVLAIFVTPERYLFALGINNSLMQIAWPDQNDITNWTSTAINTANSGRSLQGGDFFICGVPVANGVSVMFTNRTAFLAQFSGDNNVYDTPILAGSAGILGPSAVTVLGGVVYWMSDHDFWMYNGTVARLPSDDIRDFVFTTEGGNPGINQQFQALACAGTNREKQEIWFFYPDNSSSDNNRYVIFHVDQQVFSIGTLNRTTWQDSNLFAVPYATDASGNIWQHETGNDAAGQSMSSYLLSSPIDISNGDQGMDIFGFIPDMQRVVGPLDLTIYTKLYPEDAATADGPYTISPDSPPREDLRSDGKIVSFMLESDSVGADFRFGLLRLDIQPSNSRR